MPSYIHILMHLPSLRITHPSSMTTGSKELHFHTRCPCKRRQIYDYLKSQLYKWKFQFSFFINILRLSSVVKTPEMVEINNGLQIKLVDWEFLMYYELHQEINQLFAVKFFCWIFMSSSYHTKRNRERIGRKLKREEADAKLHFLRGGRYMGRENWWGKCIYMNRKK